MQHRDRSDGPRTGFLTRSATVVVGVLLASGAARAATVSSVAWDRHPSGFTAVTLTCSEPLDADAVRSYRVPDPPRLVIVVEGIRAAVEPGVLTVGNGILDRVRLGLHRDRRSSQLHVVLDLAEDDVVLHELLRVGADLVALVGPGSPPGRPPVTAPPTRTPSPPSTRPRATAEGPQPTAPPVASRGPVASSPAEPENAETGSRRPAPPARELATPTVDLQPESATRVVDITATSRGDDSTLLLITADGRLPRGCARVMTVSGEPPRLIVSIRGLSAPDLPRSISLDDPNLDRIRLIHDAETGSGELHLLLHPLRGGLTVTDQRQVGENLVLHLRPGDSDAPDP